MSTHSSPAPLRAAEVFVFRAPVEHPVRTSFGIMHDRPAVLVRLEDADGRHGWGEAWCNFPSCGAEHRGRLLAETVLPLTLNRAWSSPGALVAETAQRLQVLRLQCDEPGPLDQALAGLDMALWDLTARRAEKPLHALLGDAGMTAMPAYASGINHPGIAETIARTRAEGYRAFKIKIGFGAERDAANVEEALNALRPGERLAVDVNQGWSPEKALEGLSALARYPLLWVEEPLRCDSPAAAWAQIAAATALPLAAGENIRSDAAFDAAIAAGSLAVIQPDAAKWGGLSGCRRVALAARKAGRRYCPHYLGGGIGLLASAHLLAAVGGEGLLEVDCNPNPLRTLLAMPHPRLEEGRFLLTDAPGLGVEPDLDATREMLVFHAECR